MKNVTDETVTYKPSHKIDDDDDNDYNKACKKNPKTFFNGDGSNMVILVFFYMLQGVPLGISHAVPIILQERRITYIQQAQFSFVSWPYSLKLLWAPIIDSVYWSKFGRRKSWLIPVQYILGFLLLIISYYSDVLFGDEEGTVHPNINLLTIAFFCVNFLAATQDVAVDGWSLSMLKKENVGHSSTCNAIGMTFGFFFGYVVFVTLVSPSFCNKWIRNVAQDTSIVSISDFIRFWAIVFLVSTTLTALFKKDQELTPRRKENPCLNVFRYYKLALDLIKLSAVRELALILLTYKIGFASSDAVTPLKLVDNGISRDKLALLAVPVIPLKLILPVIISKHLVGPRPMNIFLTVVPYRLGIDLLLCLMVFLTPYMINEESVSVYYYVTLLMVHVASNITLFIISTSTTAFFANISDPRSGGTSMTLWNTFANLGSSWPSTVSLGLVDKLTFRTCKMTHSDCPASSLNATTCAPAREICSVVVDGYYIEMFVCTVMGLMWLWWVRKKVDKLQKLDEAEWRVDSKLFTAMVKI